MLRWDEEATLELTCRVCKSSLPGTIYVINPCTASAENAATVGSVVRWICGVVVVWMFFFGVFLSLLATSDEALF